MNERLQLDWFSALATGCELPLAAATELQDRGFVVLAGAVPGITRLAEAYDAAVAAATGDDIRIGSTTTRVTDFVNRGAEFDDLYVFPPLLEAAAHLVGRPFKLSSFHARTLRPDQPVQDLHVDVPRYSADWPLVGFIFMVDDFRPDNGATRLVPGSHRWSAPPDVADSSRDIDGQVLACATAGSLLIFNGSLWHGHSANTSGSARRSLQGAMIPRGGRAATDFASRMQRETRVRLGALAVNVLAL